MKICQGLLNTKLPPLSLGNTWAINPWILGEYSVEESLQACCVLIFLSSLPQWAITSNRIVIRWTFLLSLGGFLHFLTRNCLYVTEGGLCPVCSRFMQADQSQSESGQYNAGPSKSQVGSIGPTPCCGLGAASHMFAAQQHICSECPQCIQQPQGNGCAECLHLPQNHRTTALALAWNGP